MTDDDFNSTLLSDDEGLEGSRYYSKQTQIKIIDKYSQILNKYNSMMSRLLWFQDELESSESIKYVKFGVCRRLSILYYSLKEIFIQFPVDRDEVISEESSFKVDINLHAFLINISGVLDNIAWVIAHEYNLLEKYKKLGVRNVGLFDKKFKKYLDRKFLQEINNSREWHKNYIKEFRDRLAHRIPLYVPPAGLDDEEAEKYNKLFMKLSNVDLIEEPDGYRKILDKMNSLGKALPMFSIEEGINFRPLHPQLIFDFLEIEKIINSFLDVYSNTVRGSKK